MISSLRSLPRRGVRAGFTLIELLAVILIIGILGAALTPMVVAALGASEVSACEQNMQKIYQGVMLYRTKYDRLPSESGVRFFGQLYSRQAVNPSKANAEMLSCPATDAGALATDGLPWEEWWSDLDLVNGDYSSYAGRDTKNYPLRKLDAAEPLLSDDNDYGVMNHDTTTNVLYADGAVQAYEVILLQEEGILGADERVLLVGPDSPVEDLRKLTLD